MASQRGGARQRSVHPGAASGAEHPTPRLGTRCTAAAAVVLRRKQCRSSTRTRTEAARLDLFYRTAVAQWQYGGGAVVVLSQCSGACSAAGVLNVVLHCGSSSAVRCSAVVVLWACRHRPPE